MRLTDLLNHLDPRERMERRRRIYAIADWWAEHLVEKYGDRGKALFACRLRQVATSRAPAALRNHIWRQVAQRLKGTQSQNAS